MFIHVDTFAYFRLSSFSGHQKNIDYAIQHDLDFDQQTLRINKNASELYENTCLPRVGDKIIVGSITHVNSVSNAI